MCKGSNVVKRMGHSPVGLDEECEERRGQRCEAGWG